MAKILRANGTLTADTLVLKNDADLRFVYNSVEYDLKTLLKRLLYVSFGSDSSATAAECAEMVGNGSASYTPSEGKTLTINGVSLVAEGTNIAFDDIKLSNMTFAELAATNMTYNDLAKEYEGPDESSVYSSYNALEESNLNFTELKEEELQFNEIGSKKLNVVANHLWIQGIGENANYYYNLTDLICNKAMGYDNEDIALITDFVEKSIVPDPTWSFDNVVLTGGTASKVNTIYLQEYNLNYLFNIGAYPVAKDDTSISVDHISTSNIVIDL